MEHVSVSPANKKLGIMPSVSLPPGLTCRAETPCISDCYARKHMYDLQVRPSIKRAWDRNLRLWEQDPEFFFTDISRYLDYERVLHFRFHVGGDIPNSNYLDLMIKLAEKRPLTHFLAFSKRYEWLLVSPRLPQNLRIIVSAWPGLELPPFISRRYPVAWLDDGTDERIPADAHRCIGCCSHCYSCWSFKAGTHIVFRKH